MTKNNDQFRELMCRHNDNIDLAVAELHQELMVTMFEGRMKEGKFKPPVKDVFLEVCREFTVTPEIALAKTRIPYATTPRHVIRWYLTRRLELTGHITAKVTNSVNHATVIHSTKQVDNWMRTDLAFKAKVERIINRLERNAA